MIENEGSLKCFKFYFEKKKDDLRKMWLLLRLFPKATLFPILPYIIAALRSTLFAGQQSNLLPRLQRTLESVPFFLP